MGETLTAEQLYEMFKSAKGPGAVSAAQNAAYQLADNYQERAVSAQKLIDGIRSGWTGEAADAASQGMAPFAENALRTGDELNSTQDLVYRQVHSYYAAANAMRPVPPEPRMQNVISVLAAGQTPQSMVTQLANYSAATTANTDAYATYVNSSQFNATNLPNMSTPMSAQGAPVSVVSPQPKQVAVPSATAGPRMSTGAPGSPKAHGMGTQARASRGVVPPTVSGRGAGTSTGVPAPGGNGQTVTSSAVPTITGPDTGMGETSSSPASGGGWSAPGPGGQGSSLGTGNGNIVARLNSGGDGAGDGMTGEAPGAGSAGGSVGRTGSAIGGRGGLPAAEEEGGGSRSGAEGNAGVATEEDAAEQGLSSGRSASGVTAGGMGSSRSAGKGGEDAEHKRRYGYEEDPELFENKTKVAPQVIGESPAEYQARIAREMG